jgi:Fe-S cluster assembly iron-binding protein IscA
MIKLDLRACKAIKSALSERKLPLSIRIEVRSTGCCDASVGLTADTVDEFDLLEEIDGLIIIISPETYELVGEVTISYVDDDGRRGFFLTSSRPLNEWSGFAVCNIRI